MVLHQLYLGRPPCVSCPATPPDCSACDAGYVCILTLQTCEECADTYCLPSAATSTMPVEPSATSRSPTSSATSTTTSSGQHSETHSEKMHRIHRNAIIGGTIGGVVFVIVVLLLGIFIYKNRKYIFHPKKQAKIKTGEYKDHGDTLETLQGSSAPAPTPPTIGPLASSIGQSNLERRRSQTTPAIGTTDRGSHTNITPVGTRYEQSIPYIPEYHTPVEVPIPMVYRSEIDSQEPQTGTSYDTNHEIDIPRRKTLRDKVRQRTSMLLPDRRSKQFRLPGLGRTSTSNKDKPHDTGPESGSKNFQYGEPDSNLDASNEDTTNLSVTRRISMNAPQISLPPMPSQLTLSLAQQMLDEEDHSWQNGVPEEEPRIRKSNSPSLTESKEYRNMHTGSSAGSGGEIGRFNAVRRVSAPRNGSDHSIPIVDPRGYNRSAYDEFPLFPDELPHLREPDMSINSSEFGRRSNTINSYYEGKYEGMSQDGNHLSSNGNTPNISNRGLGTPVHLDASGEFYEEIQQALQRESNVPQAGPHGFPSVNYSIDPRSTWGTSHSLLSPVQPLSISRSSRSSQLPPTHRRRSSSLAQRKKI